MIALVFHGLDVLLGLLAAVTNSSFFLLELGNPYTLIGADRSGRTGIEFGVYGVPETFVIDTNGVVVYRFVGPVLDADDIEDMREANFSVDREGEGKVSPREAARVLAEKIGL